jgi:prevent-host-death family protein
MITEVTIVDFQQDLEEMLDQVQNRNESFVINKDGEPVAALVNASLFARISLMRKRFDALSSRISQAYENVPAEKGLVEIDAAVAANRK